MREEIGDYLLLHTKANPKATDFTGYTPLHDAAANGHFNIVTYLVEKRAALKAIQRLSESRPPSSLMLAIKKGDFPTIKSLLSHTTDVNYQDKEGNTALHEASSVNQAKERMYY